MKKKCSMKTTRGWLIILFIFVDILKQEWVLIVNVFVIFVNVALNYGVAVIFLDSYCSLLLLLWCELWLTLHWSAVPLVFKGIDICHVIWLRLNLTHFIYKIIRNYKCLKLTYIVTIKFLFICINSFVRNVHWIFLVLRVLNWDILYLILLIFAFSTSND